MKGADQIIEEIRSARREMSAECGHDPARLVDLLQGLNRRYAAQVRKYAEMSRTRSAAVKPPAPASRRGAKA